MENITLDPEYENLIIEVNKLKENVAEKIAERDMLAFHVIPDIEYKYMSTIGVLENDAFTLNLKLLKINRTIDIYKEKKRKKQDINEEEINELVELEFEDVEDEYIELQEETLFDFDDEFTDKITQEILKLLNIIYKNLIKKLSPLINPNNTRLDNQLYELLEKAYREFDLTMMTKLQTICEQIKDEPNLTIGDVKSLNKTKARYLDLLNENEQIISHIKNSETFEKKKILDDEKLIEEVENELTTEIDDIEKKIKTAEEKLKKLQNET